MPKHTLKCPLLDWRGLEFVLVRFAYRLLFHIHSFCLIRHESGNRRDFGLMPRKRLTARLKRRRLAAG